MDARLTPCGRRRKPILCAILSIVLWAGATVYAAAEDFQQLFDQAVRAQQQGDLKAAAANFEAASRVAPGNVDVLRRLALVHGHLQQYGAALVAVDRGLRVDPGNTDLRLARGRILAWAGRYDDALRAVDAVIAQQPKIAEAYALRGRIAFYQGRLAAADAGFAEALRLEPGNAEASAGRADVARARKASAAGGAGKVANAVPRWRIDTGYVQSRFSRLNFEDWHEGFIRIEHRWPSRTALSARVDTSNRFGTTETAAGAGIAQQFNPGLFGYLEGSVAPGADFLPRWTVAAGGNLRVVHDHGPFGPLLLTADFRHKSYATADIQNIDPGIELYGLGGRVWLTARWINAFDRDAGSRLAGWYGRADWQAAAPFRLFAGMSDSPETEVGVTVDTRSVFGGLAVDLTPSVRLNADIAREDRENSYIRNVYGVSLTLRY
ncbi:MAG: YaiO family outer membrane beta-barrel protein [Alphaproteobacteria bacterium]|nr:YaiO family outer membrane beta-barrel protein [Alphaproteobacteria bacterium]